MRVGNQNLRRTEASQSIFKPRKRIDFITSKFPRAYVQESQPVSLFLGTRSGIPFFRSNRRQKIVPTRFEQMKIADGSRADDLRDFPLDDLSRTRLACLVANGNAMTSPNQ